MFLWTVLYNRVPWQA